MTASAALSRPAPGAAPAAAASISAPIWRTHLIALAFAWLALLIGFGNDALHLLDLWWNSSTFNHCLLIVPVIGWLVWLRWEELAQITPRCWLPGLVWIAGGAFVWLVGDAASVALFRQIGLIVMLQGAVPALLGPQVARGLLFPLFYMAFLVPIGEELVPPLQTLTAAMAMALLKLAGVPAQLDGIFITTPAGYFAVAEACSGVKFLVAMAALSALTAHLCFTSNVRRALFILVALIVPILANGVRAFSTIWIAEHWGAAFAEGADHVIYGWVFFAIVILIVGALARPWFDRSADDVPISAATLRHFLPGRGATLAVALPLAGALAFSPHLLSAYSAARAQALPPLTIAPVDQWTIVASGAPHDWAPRFDGADQRQCVRYAHNGQPRLSPVDMCIAAFVRQGEGRELVGYGQGAVDPDSDWRWGHDLAPIDAMPVMRITANGQNRDAMTLYRISTEITASRSRVKWLTLKARLIGGDERAYALILSAPTAAGQDGRAAIDALLRAAGGVGSWLNSATPAQN